MSTNYLIDYEICPYEFSASLPLDRRDCHEKSSGDHIMYIVLSMESIQLVSTFTKHLNNNLILPVFFIQRVKCILTFRVLAMPLLRLLTASGDCSE